MKPTSMSKKKLVEFLYLLMRDAAPTGEIVRIVRMIDYPDNSGENTYSSKELAAYAERLADELLQ